MVEQGENGQERQEQDGLAGTELGKVLGLGRDGGGHKADDAVKAIKSVRKYLGLDDGGEVRANDVGGGARREGQGTARLAEIEKVMRGGNAGMLPEGFLKKLGKGKMAKGKPLGLKELLRQRAK